MASILSNSPNAACLLVLLLETLIGTVTNAIVMAMIFKGKKIMKTGNIIRIALNTSNVCYSILVFASVFGDILDSENVEIINPTLAYIVYSLIMFTISSSSWLTAILSFFYFIKILDFKARAILWTKKNINAVLPWMIIGVEVMAFLSSFLSVTLYINPQKSSMNESMINVNNSLLNTDMGFLSTALIVSCVPFLIVVVTTICTAATLKRHSHNMMTNMETFNKKQIKRFNNTIFKIKRLLLAYSFYYLCVVLFHAAIAAHLSVLFWAFLLMLSSCSMVQSVLLVIGNPELQEAAKEMLKCIICCQKIHS